MEESKDRSSVITKEEIDELERELEEYKKIAVSNKAFFGEPFEELKSRLTEEVARKLKERCKDWVINPILGFVHWATVKYALDNDYISKKGDKWHIVGKEIPLKFKNGPDHPWVSTERFDRFEKRLKALKARENKREFAIQQTIENQ